MVNKITTPPTTSELIGKVNEIIDGKQDTLVSGTNIKTINNTSILGSGNIDIQGGGSSYTAGTGIDITNDVISVKDPVLLNMGSTNKSSLGILGSYNSVSSSAVWVGYGSDAYNYAVSLGYQARANNTNSIAIGYSAVASANYAIQIGYGTNSQSMTMAVGFYNGTTSYEYQLLDGTTGLIPSGRLPVDNSSITINSNGQLQATPERNIGEIIQSMLPLTDAGLHLLDGSLIQGGGVYDAFVQYIANLVNIYPQCFTDETTWQNTVNSKGVCGKFVYNSTNNTVRLPKITGFIEGTVDTNALGDLVNAGLPNITGSIEFGNLQNISWPYAVSSTSGAFYSENSGYVADVGTNSVSNYNHTGNFDASLSNSIYGNSSTVQPQSIKVFYYIVVATTTKTDIEVDIDKIITDLNSKANDTDVVHKTGDETIGGTKTFDTNVLRTGIFSPSGTDAIKTIDTNGKGETFITSYYYNTSIYNRLVAHNTTANTYGWIDIVVKDNGEMYAAAPASEINGSIVTTANHLKSTNGFYKLGNGLIIQWGQIRFTSYNATGSVTFPIPFTSTNYSITSAGRREGPNGQGSLSITETYSTTGFSWRSAASQGYYNSIQLWIAIGY